MNSNILHNLLNLAIVIVGALAAFDWTGLFSASTAALLVTILGGAKIVINVVRDGLAGLVKEQPPVQ